MIFCSVFSLFKLVENSLRTAFWGGADSAYYESGGDARRLA